MMSASYLYTMVRKQYKYDYAYNVERYMQLYKNEIRKERK